MSADDEILREFLLESSEGLNQLDRDFVELERDPADRNRLGAIFRCIHTIKGASGFLALHRLEAVAHAGESLLSRLRNGDFLFDGAMTSALLAMVDAIRAILGRLDASGIEGDERYEQVVAALTALTNASPTVSDAPLAVEPASTTPPDDVSALFPPRAPVPVEHEHAPPTQLLETPMLPTTLPPTSTDPPASSPARADALADSGDAAQTRGSPISDSAIRVDVGLLDRVMNLVGELVLARNQILQFGATVKDAGFANASQRLNLLTTELQEGVMKTRMQPIGNVWNKFPRVVRDLAQTCGKRINLELDGTETELDRTIIEAIKDPLTHAVRNAIDHGIETPEARLAAGKTETGRLLLRAFHEGGQVNIEISDDGAGIDVGRIRSRAIERGVVTAERAARMNDREILYLIFHPGFSTAAKVTNVSGRGVGMDVVKTNIERIGGTVDVHTRVGFGTTLKIKIPLTLAIIPALIVTSSNNRFAIPQVSLLELVRLEGGTTNRAIESLHGTSVYRLRGNLLPLVFLDHALQLPRASTSVDAISIVVVQADDRQFGLVVDGISDTEEIVVKPLGKELKGLAGFAGATIMGDGRVALILDVLGIAQRSNVVSASRERTIVDKTAAGPARQEEREALLLFRLGRDGRMALPLSLVARLEEIPLSAVERAGGRDVVQYRGAILPLIDVRQLFGVAGSGAADGPLQVIVYSEHGRSVGLVVDQILDAVEALLSCRQHVGGEGTLGSAVVQGKVTDILDVHGVIRRAAPGFFAQEAA